jgi:hypothetical protein
MKRKGDPERTRFVWRMATARYKARLLARIKALLGDRRQQCGLSETEDAGPIRLEFAHVALTGVKGRGRGSYQRLRDVEKNPECYRLLCRSCHMNLDFGYDPWEPRGLRKPDPAHLELEAVPF